MVKKESKVETVQIDTSYDAMRDMSYKDFREIVLDQFKEAMMWWEPRKVFEFICEFPDLFEISKPVQEDGKFVYTVRVKDGV